MAKIDVFSTRYRVEPIFQWSKNQILTIYGLSLPPTPVIQFTSEVTNGVIEATTTMGADGVIKAKIPDVLLQKPYKIIVYVGVKNLDEFKTLYELTLPVKARKKPCDHTLNLEEETFSCETYDLSEIAPLIPSTVTLSGIRKGIQECIEGANQLYGTSFATVREVLPYLKKYVADINADYATKEADIKADYVAKKKRFSKILDGSATEITYDDLKEVNELPGYCFAYRSSLLRVEIPDNVKKFGSYTFSNSPNVEGIYIKDLSYWLGLTFESSERNPIWRGIMQGGIALYVNGERLTNLVVPEGITEIKPYAFVHCPSINSIILPDSVTSIGESAFSNTSVNAVTIPDSVTNIGNGAFQNCIILKEITYLGTMDQWNAITLGTVLTGSSVTIHCSDGDITRSQ